MFGSDYPWEDPGRAAEIVRGLVLDEAEKEAILHKNAAKLLCL
jgi:predicted TIM-barrel fold metal-dependent hydrolase